jgi:hypothetical protein
MDPASDFLDEGATLLPHSNGVSITPARRPYGYRLLIHTGLVLIVLVTVPLFLCAGLPSDPLKAAEAILSRAPIIVCPVLSHNFVIMTPCFPRRMDLSCR